MAVMGVDKCEWGLKEGYFILRPARGKPRLMMRQFIADNSAARKSASSK
jgi:hypothetical protein